VSSKWSLSLRFPHQKTLLYPICAACPGHLLLFDLMTRILFSKQYKSLSSSLCSFKNDLKNSIFYFQTRRHHTRNYVGFYY
jgi:hypothetical protein